MPPGDFGAFKMFALSYVRVNYSIPCFKNDEYHGIFFLNCGPVRTENYTP